MRSLTGLSIRGRERMSLRKDVAGQETTWQGLRSTWRTWPNARSSLADLIWHKTSLQQPHKLSLVWARLLHTTAGSVSLMHANSVGKLEFRCCSEIKLLSENIQWSIWSWTKHRTGHKADCHINKGHARTDSTDHTETHGAHPNLCSRLSCMLHSFLKLQTTICTFKCSLTHKLLKPSRLSYWHLWLHQAKPCHADLFFHYHFKTIALCQTVPEKDHLQSGDKAQLTRHRGGWRSSLSYCMHLAKFN